MHGRKLQVAPKSALPLYCVQVSPAARNDWSTGQRIVMVDERMHEVVPFAKASVSVGEQEAWALVELRSGTVLRVPAQFVATSRQS